MASYTVASDAYVMLGQPDQAREEMALGASRLPGKPELLIPYGRLLINQGRYTEAREVLRGISAPQPSQTIRARKLVVESYQKTNRIAEAIDEMVNLVETFPTDLSLRMSLVDLYSEASLFAKAVDTLRAAKKFPEVPPGSLDARIRDLLKQEEEKRKRRGMEETQTLAP